MNRLSKKTEMNGVFFFVQTESEVAALNRKVQEIEENLEKSEERSLTAQQKLAEASQAADESLRMCKVLENRSQQDEERMDQLTNQLKEARMLAEDADGKSDEVRFLYLKKKLQGRLISNSQTIFLRLRFKFLRQ